MPEALPTIKGVSTIRFGIDGVLTLTGFEAGSLDMEVDQLIDEKALNANGAVISRILGDAHAHVRATGLYTGATLPAVGAPATIKYDDAGSTVTDATFFFNGKSRRRYTNKGNLMYEMEFERHALITP